LIVALRGLVHRAGASLSIVLVATVAVAAVAIGPTYYLAAQSSILQDGVRQADTLGRGFEVTSSGQVRGTIGETTQLVRTLLAHYIGGPAQERRLFTAPVEAIETTVVTGNETVPLVWRTAFCAHLKLSAGRCPGGLRQIVVSSSLAAINGWHVGQRVTVAGWPPFMITGVYTITVPETAAPYWFNAGTQYFPAEAEPKAPPYDAMFTSQATINSGPVAAQGNDVVDMSLTAGHLSAADVPRISAAMTGMTLNQQLTQFNATFETDIPDTLAFVRDSWRTVAVPVFLITAQLLLLAWLLLFLVVTDAAEARGPEIALAKVRGRGRWRTLTFGLSEPVILLVIALPAGLLAGWGITAALARVLLRPGTPVGLPSLAWAGAAAATAGGLVAVMIAARRTLSRTVLDQWQRASRGAAERGWVVDAILLTATVAGLIELRVSGQIGSAHQGALGLLVPGLLGLAVAVVASRLLVTACRAGFGVTRRRARIGLFLALRHVARRPGGMRTTIVLATAFALAGFAVGTWSVTVQNIRRVADARVGAAAVLTVTPPPGGNLARIVDRIDPRGREAMAVDEYTSVSGGTAGQVLLGVDPQRFARIAAWQPGWARQPLTSIAAALAPPAPPPVVLNGDAVRIRFSGLDVQPAGSTLVLDVYEEGAAETGQTPLYFGAVTGSQSSVQPLTGCPCVVANLTVSGPAQVSGAAQPVTGMVTVSGIDVRSGGRWTPVNAGLSTHGRWQESGPGTPVASQLSFAASGLTWQFHSQPGTNPTILSVNRPYPLPAIVAQPLAGGSASGGSASGGSGDNASGDSGGLYQATGLDGSPLNVRAVALAGAVPGAPANGIVVDRTYAERAAGIAPGSVSDQVWLAPGALASVRPRLIAAGVRISATETSAAQQSLLIRRGPALATVLFLADAAAAALLAAGAAILGLYLSGRRRRYEYAALAASRVSPSTLRRALLIEQAIVLGFGAVVGLASGFVATLLAIRSIPEFIAPPSSPPLSYTPVAGEFAALVGLALVLLIVAAVAASTALVRSVRPDLLREAQP
jgi:putative ABC transport system permease protein